MGALRKAKQPRNPQPGQAEASQNPAQRPYYKPFIDQPELPPRFDRDGIHRDVLGRPERFVPRTGYRPRDELEKSQVNMKDENALDQAEWESSPAERLRREAATNKIVAQCEQEEKDMEMKRKNRRAKLAYMLDQETAKLTHQRPEYTPVRETVADKQIIDTQFKAVMAKLNPVASKAIRNVMQYDYGYAQKLRRTADSIKKMVKARITNSSSEAIKIIHRAQEEAAEEKEGAQAVARAKISAEKIRAKARVEGFREAAALRKARLLKGLKLGGKFTKTKHLVRPAQKVGGRGLLVPTGPDKRKPASSVSTAGKVAKGIATGNG